MPVDIRKMIEMNTIQKVNPAQAYFEGMLWIAKKAEGIIAVKDEK